MIKKVLRCLSRFRWVACQIEELKHCPNQKVIMETLKSLPKDLETTYDQILQRIDEKQIPFTKVILQWLMLGMAPLGLEQLAIFVTFDASSGQFDSNLSFTHPDDVIHVCSSLVIKTADDNVQLAHASVKEYFMHKPRRISLSDIELGHAAISHCCLSYILLKSGRLMSLTSSYSVSYWPNHYQLSNKDPVLQDLARSLLWGKAYGVFDGWGKVNHYASQLEHGYHESPLHYAAKLGLQDIIEIEIKNNKWSWTYSALIEIASDRGYIGIVRLLLDKGVDVNARGKEFSNALQAASSSGHAEIVRLLLDKGADVNAQSGKCGNGLQAASDGGHAEIVRLLLDKGADVNVQSQQYGNALQAASDGGHAEIVRLLLDKGADVNQQSLGRECRNALYAASFIGHTEVARVLLDKGADVNAQGGRYDNPLQATLREGHTEIARLLLDKGADVNAQGGRYGNALQVASCQGHAEIARHLLEKGADVNAQGGQYGNALHAASSRGHTEIVRLLLDKGADVNAQGGRYGNALKAASFNDHTEIAKLLLYNGAIKVNPHDKEYDTALQAASQAASQRGHAEIVDDRIESADNL